MFVGVGVGGVQGAHERKRSLSRFTLAAARAVAPSNSQLTTHDQRDEEARHFDWPPHPPRPHQ